MAGYRERVCTRREVTHTESGSVHNSPGAIDSRPQRGLAERDARLDPAEGLLSAMAARLEVQEPSASAVRAHVCRAGAARRERVTASARDRDAKRKVGDDVGTEVPDDSVVHGRAYLPHWHFGLQLLPIVPPGPDGPAGCDWV